MNRVQIRFTGAGGQGAISAGEALVVAAISLGLHAIQTPTYNSQVRGGPTLSDIILGSDEIYFPRTIVGEIDFILSTANNSYQRYKEGLRFGEIVVIDPNLVYPTEDDKKLWRFISIPIVEIAKSEVGKIEAQSAVALAIAVHITKCVTPEAALDAMLSKVPAKYAEVNRKAFAIGMHHAEEGLKKLFEEGETKKSKVKTASEK